MVPGALLATLSLTALYFVMCLRLTHFREWQYQEDVKRIRCGRMVQPQSGRG